jgi:hypothetical protein
METNVFVLLARSGIDIVKAVIGREECDAKEDSSSNSEPGDASWFELSSLIDLLLLRCSAISTIPTNSEAISCRLNCSSLMEDDVGSSLLLMLFFGLGVKKNS